MADTPPDSAPPPRRAPVHMGLRVLVSQKLPFEIAVHKGPVDFEIGGNGQIGRIHNRAGVSQRFFSCKIAV